MNQSKPILVIVSIKPFTRQSFVLHAKLNGRFLLRQPLKNTLRTEPIQILIRQYMERNTEDVNISLENAMKILTESSKLCLKIKAKKTYKRIKKSSNKKWFDCECRLKRHELRKVSNEKHRDPLNSEVRERYHKTLNDYKKLLDTKKREFQTQKNSTTRRTSFKS